MSNHLKGSLKVLVDYSLSVLLFTLFIAMFYGVTQKRFADLLPVYSFIIFLMLLGIVYGDIKKLGEKEKRPYNKLNPYPLKGLVLGILGFLPFMLLEVVGFLLTLDTDFLNRIKHLTLNTLMSPLYWIVRLCGGSALAYAAASAAVPVIAMLGYVAGYYGFDSLALFRKISKGRST